MKTIPSFPNLVQMAKFLQPNKGGKPSRVAVKRGRPIDSITKIIGLSNASRAIGYSRTHIREVILGTRDCPDILERLQKISHPILACVTAPHLSKYLSGD